MNNPSELAKTTQSRKKWWKNLSKHLKYRGNWVKKNRGYIMVVAIMITTLTFQQVASPPSGVWSQSGNVTFYTGHNIKVDARTSIIGSIDPLHYFYFIIFNAISFIASVVVTFLPITLQQKMFITTTKNRCNNIEVIAIIYAKCCNKICGNKFVLQKKNKKKIVAINLKYFNENFDVIIYLLLQ